MKLTNIFKKNKNHIQCMYFVNKGDRCGQFLLFLKYDKQTKIYSVLALPECEPIFLSEFEMMKYLNEKRVELVNRVPNDVFNESISEFNLRKSLIIK